VRIDARPTRAEEKIHTRTGNDFKLEHYRQPHGMNPQYGNSVCNQASVGFSLPQTATVATVHDEQPAQAAKRNLLS